MELALEQRVYKVDHRLSDRLRSMAEQLGALKAGPRDVVEIHRSTLKEKSLGGATQKAQAYLDEARMMLVEVMGYVLSFYRNYYLSITEQVE